MTLRDASDARASILTCPTHAEAQERALHLAEHAVPARLVARPDGWLLSVAASDGVLAAGRCGVDAPSALPRVRRRGRTFGALAGALLALGGYGLGALTAPPGAARADVQTSRVAQADDDRSWDRAEV